jgi:hypothetical protein
MDIAPRYSRHSCGFYDEHRIYNSLAAILSPAIAGYVIDLTGNWYLPFIACRSA